MNNVLKLFLGVPLLIAQIITFHTGKTTKLTWFTKEGTGNESPGLISCAPHHNANCDVKLLLRSFSRNEQTVRFP